MPNINFRKLYKESIISPGIILTIIAAIYSTIANLTRPTPIYGDMYRWYERVITDMLAALIFSILIGILSLTIFLNKYEKIYKNRKLSIICWFLLPSAFIILVIAKAINEFIFVNSKWEIIYSLIAVSPFIFGLVRGYKKFKTLLIFQQGKHGN